MGKYDCNWLLQNLGIVRYTFLHHEKILRETTKKMAPFRFGNSSSAEWVCDLTSSDYRAREGLFGPLIHMLGATLWALDCLFPSTGTVPLIRCNPNNQPHFGMIIRRCFRVYWVTWDHYDDQIRVTIPIEVGFEASPKSIVEWLSPLPKSVIAGKNHNAIPSLLAIASPSSWQKNAIRQEKISDKWHFYPFGGSLSLSLSMCTCNLLQSPFSWFTSFRRFVSSGGVMWWGCPMWPGHWKGWTTGTPITVGFMVKKKRRKPVNPIIHLWKMVYTIHLWWVWGGLLLGLPH